MKIYKVIFAVLGLVIAPLITAAQVAQPTISRLSVSSAAPGKSVTIYGTNLLYANTITLYNTANRNLAIEVNAVAADQDGSEETFVIPQNVAPGNYAVAVWAQGSSISSNETYLTVVSNTIQQPVRLINLPATTQNNNAEALAKVNQTKLQLIQLIQQLILELQKQLAAISL